MSEDNSATAGAVPLPSLTQGATATHTPGPWRLHYTEEGAFGIENDNRSAVLCQRAPWKHRAAESIANGRLIAAAPDLLEALQALEQRGHTQATWDLAKRAIAKATVADTEEQVLGSSRASTKASGIKPGE